MTRGEDGFRVWLDDAQVRALAQSWKPNTVKAACAKSRADKELRGTTVARVLRALRNPHARVDDVAIAAGCSIEQVCRIAKFKGHTVEAATEILEAEREMRRQEKENAKAERDLERARWVKRKAHEKAMAEASARAATETTKKA